MSAYASTPGFAGNRRHPSALLLIVGGHAVLIAAVMTAKMDLPVKFIPDITRVRLLRNDPPPPEPLPPPPKRERAQPRDSHLDSPDIIVRNARVPRCVRGSDHEHLIAGSEHREDGA